MDMPWRVLIGLLLLALACSASAQQHSDRLAHIRILHYNDFHAHNLPEIEKNGDSIGGSVTLKSYIDHFKGELLNREHLEGDHLETIVLNAGDEFQGSPICSITQGASQIELLNAIHPDYLTLGNHEFDYGWDTLQARLKKIRGVEILCSNLWSNTSNKPVVAPWKIWSKPGYPAIGIIGGITEDLPNLTMPQNLKGIRVHSLAASVRQAINEMQALASPPDLFLALTHNGVDADSALAIDVPQLAVIVGGHSHTALQQPLHIGKTTIVQAGSFGKYLGILDITYDSLALHLISAEDHLELLEAGRYPIDTIVQKIVDRQEFGIRSYLDVPIATLTEAWDLGSPERNAAKWAADITREIAHADIAFINTGSVRKNLHKGAITRRDLWEVFPFDNRLATGIVRGDTLLSMLKHQWSNYEDIDGHRRPELMQIGGMSYRVDAAGVYNVRIAGKPLDKKRYYRFATNEYVASKMSALFGSKARKIICTIQSTVLRDAYLLAAEREKTLHTVSDVRITLRR